MPTYIKEVDHVHENHDSNSNSYGILLAILAFIIVIVLFAIFARPYLFARQTGPNINIPDKVDVNIQK